MDYKINKNENVNCTLDDITEILEEAIFNSKKHKEEDITDFLECLLEIHKNNKINNHKHVYAYLENLGLDENKQHFATIKLFFRR